MTHSGSGAIPPAAEALAMLRAGNARFAATSIANSGAASAVPSARQQPFAIILGCSDARVPAEIVFDQGLGDLFVIRVAGNIVAPSQVGSVEFAAEAFGTRLVVVVGHSDCGAITAAVKAVRDPEAIRSRNLRAIVDRLVPAVQSVLEREPGIDDRALIAQGVRINIRASADHLRHGSEILEALIRHDGLLVVGAEYSVQTGVVDFFDGVPSPA